MKQYIKHHNWNIIEDGFIPENNRISESIFSLGNGKMGMRGNFEEYYSGDTLQGMYIGGVYYPDKTRVGWWKNGYPEYFAKVLNAPAWHGIKLKIDDIPFDLAKCKIEEFNRILNMKHGYLERNFIAETTEGKRLKIQSIRFLSIVDDELGVIKYSITPLNFSETVSIILDVNADIENEDSNYDEKFWVEVEKMISTDCMYIRAATKKTFFHTCTAIKYKIFQGKNEFNIEPIDKIEREKYVAHIIHLPLYKNKTTSIYKYGAITSSLNYPKEIIHEKSLQILDYALKKGFDKLLEEHSKAWEFKWLESDIVIEGDEAAQQGIRFNIFQLNQTYTGKDERLNIGPKGFTGEKYGGSTYWDTEAYCLPFYLSTADYKIARNLLVYRYKHLQKAIENAEKLGFKNGAALFPMVTMNGEECHNEWEITFQEIHRNGAIAFAIFNYIRYTNDYDYLYQYGLEVLIAISRFWAQRVNFSDDKQKYVMLGVTGPNEYENNINNNWYTSTIAIWTLKYTIECYNYVKKSLPKEIKRIIEKTKLNEKEEFLQWNAIINNMYFPYDEKRKIFLQQDNFLDKELRTVEQLSNDERPINQKWSWDRILRSCFIKQADVLQGIYFFEDDYDIDTITRNFDFYEPMTVHESSLSSCIHSILAAKIGREEKAYNLYLNASRLDLDDYNNDTRDGLHITSMGGTWLTIVQGFGGMRVKNNCLIFNPMIPEKWTMYSFKILFRNSLLKIEINKKHIRIVNEWDEPVKTIIYDNLYTIDGKKSIEVSLKSI